MLAIAVRFGVLLAALWVLYRLVAIWQRWVTVRDLRAEHARGAAPGLTCEDYVTKGLADYNRSWAKKSLLGIFIVPLLAMIGLLLLANYG